MVKVKKLYAATLKYFKKKTKKKRIEMRVTWNKTSSMDVDLQKVLVIQHIRITVPR